MKLIVLLVVALQFVLSGVVAYQFHHIHELAQDNDTARAGLCAVRSNLNNKIARTESFLEQNPNGIPGIPGRLFRQGLNDDYKQRDALKKVECD